MSPERNEPCPCGSGKKYKKCCGSLTLNQDPVERNRDIAYLGEIGRQRKQFCLDYTAYKKIMISRGEQMLRDELTSAGKIISCQKGCAKCCVLYVFANLQEAECITYYLYQHEDVLKHFLAAYSDRQKVLAPMTIKMERLDRLVSKVVTERLTPQEMERFEADSRAYTLSKLPCPFLIDDACSIYEVRPFACARLVATTPAENCRYDDPTANRATYRQWGFKVENDMPYFIRTRDPIVSGRVPEMVHRILEGGYSFLASIDGLEKLNQSGT